MSLASYYRPATLFIIAAATASCASVGSKFDATKVDQLQPGKSTISDAVALLGNYASETTLANGTKLLQWQYVTAVLTSAQSDYVAILFDQQGKMIRVTQRTRVGS